MTHVTNPADYQLEVQGSACIIRLPISFTVLKAAAFKKWFQTLHEQYPQTNCMVLDLSETTFIDSSGIGALVICRRLCQTRSSELILRDVSAQVMMALSVTDLNQIFTIENSVSASPATVPVAAHCQLLAAHPSVNSRAKRMMDIVGALVGLSITSILFVPIAIAIKLDSNGPALFGQVRCSWMGKRFRIWKFRSMVTDAEALKHRVQNQVEGPLFKNENDPRVTKVGRFLRKTSLDELPQFWNVLKGEMSLVGTRPPTPDEIEHYEVPEWQRLDVKPGMTGEWQVNGRSTVKKFEDVIRLDLRYQENWSLMYDVKLILKTVLVLFSKKAGAS